MKTPIVFALAALVTFVAPSRAADGPPPTSCDRVVAVDVGNASKVDPKKVVAKVAAGANKRRGPPALQLRGRGLDAAALTALGHEPGLAEVATLDVPCLGAAPLAALLSPGVFPGVMRLVMQGCRLDDRSAGALASLAARDAITAVDLAGGNASPGVLKALLGLERHAPLTVFVSGLSTLSTAALGELGKLAPNPAVTLSVAVRCPDLTRLEKTALLKHVSRIEVACGDAGAKALARSTNTGALRGIKIDACAGEDDESDHEMTRESALALVEAPGLAGIVALAFDAAPSCEQPGIGRSGLADLLSAPFAPRLQSLELAGQTLGRKGVALLVSTERLPALRHLVLRSERLVAEDVRALSQTGPLAARLEELSLSGGSGDDDDDNVVLDDKTTTGLAASLAMPKLRRLEIEGAWLSAAGRERLRSAPWTGQLEVMDFAPPRTRLCAPRWHGTSDPHLD
jgi:hypothetical protein